MAKKKKSLNVGGVDFSGFTFNSPVLQKAYKKWFIDMPLRAPVEVEYYDPTETSTGEVKRSPVNTRMDPYEIARGEMMAKQKYGWESGNEAVFKQSPIVKRKISKGTKAGIRLDNGKRMSLGEGGESLITARDRANARFRALGIKPVKQEKQGASLWTQVMDVLLRGNYAAAEGFGAAARESDKPGNQKWDLGDFGDRLEAFGKGAIQGVTGKKKTTFKQVLDENKFSEKVTGGLTKLSGDSKWGARSAKKAGGYAENIAGLGLDIGADPTTYLGIGLIPKVGKGEQLVAKNIKHLEEGSKIVSRTRKTPHTFDELETELLSGARHVRGKVRHTEEALIHKPIIKMRNSIAKTRQAEIRAELRTTDEWARIFDRGGKAGTGSLTAATKQLNMAAKEAAEKEADDWMYAAVKNYQDTVAENIKKGLGIGVAGKNGKKVTVVPAPLVSFVSNRIKAIDPVEKGLKSAQKYLQASAGVTPDLHNIRLASTSMGMVKAIRGQTRLRNAFAGVHKDMQESAWQSALNRNTHSGQRVVVDGVDQDAAEFFNKEVDILDQHVTGVTTGNTPMSLREMNLMLPPGGKYKFVKGRNGLPDVRKSLQKWELQNGPQALHVAQQAYEHANAKRSMLVSAADTFGMRTTGTGALKNAKPIFDDMKKRGWREINEAKSHGLLKGVLFDPDTAQGMEKLLTIMENERNWNKWLRKLARITNPIKFYLTVPNPGYHIRNSIGDAFINELDNVGVPSYNQAMRVLRNTEKKYGGAKPLLSEEGNLLEKAFERKGQKVLFHTRLPQRKPNGTKLTAVTEAEIYAGSIQYGITQSFTRGSFGSLTENPNALNTMGSKLKAKVTAWSETRENYFRLAHFIDLVKKNPNGALTLDENMAWAAARIRKTHFDYTDFTRWEKQTASNIIPFYKWTRKAVPLMLEIMFTQPGKAILPTKAQINLSMMAGYPNPLENDPFPNMQGAIPKWMIDAGYMPGNPASGMFGSDRPGMFAVADPFRDTFAQTLQPLAQDIGSGNPKRMLNTILQQSNPALKVPYELIQNENTFLSQDTDVPIYRKDTKKRDIKNYLINQFPYARQANRAFGGDPEQQNLGAASSQLGGIYNQELTPSNLRGELSRQKIEAEERWDKVKADLTKQFKAQGIKPPQTATEWDEFLQVYAERMGRNYQPPSKKRLETIIK